MYRLMIVDDSNVIRNRIERGLAGSDIQFEVVATASNGNEAVEQFKKTRPQFVTMDITMPGMDGLECVQSLMTLDPNVNILVISALSDEYTGLLALSYGARGFLNKPFRDEELAEALQQLVANQ
ncbi:response regulator [Kingella negevensis]|uniref:Chemotaxis protein CheY n=1 Tax=Kingella negevensis TaxID=1522312 RepID=A0A238HFU8_9NEIS|nr:response regulator [Kingella negevensis]MDK4684893.1 response regulator [Kingella negevensis]MDK4698074.1 response regulator [Kingella negevensis]MDK4707139.1 response regulator [Kingella negevensis]MDK4710717.1 response regulator [Kingella negevensis]WII93083.1 response regulator [Kingella negevensis]